MEGRDRAATPWLDTTHDALDYALLWMQYEEDRGPLRTGCRPLDKATRGGLKRGACTLIAGPTCGKSKLLLRTALCAARSGIATLYAPLQVASMREAAARVICEEANAPFSDLEDFGTVEKQLLSEAAERVKGFPLTLLTRDRVDDRIWEASREAFGTRSKTSTQLTGDGLVIVDGIEMFDQGVEMLDVGAYGTNCVLQSLSHVVWGSEVAMLASLTAPADLKPESAGNAAAIYIATDGETGPTLKRLKPKE